MRLTTTRNELRRAIAIELMMPFALRFTLGYSNPTSSTTNDRVIDSRLTQPVDYWNNSWIYIASGATSAVSRVQDFGYGQLLLETPLPFSVTPSATYELHSIFNAIEIHHAINRAIYEGYPSFYDEAEDDLLVVTENTLDYPLTVFTKPVEIVLKVEIEQPVQKMYGTIQSVNNFSFVSNDIDFEAIDNTWLVSFYGKTQNQVGRWTTINSINKTTKTINCDAIAGYTLYPEMKIMVWNANYQNYVWYAMRTIHTDRKEWANRLRLNERPDSLLGSRIRVRFSTVPPILETDTATTVVPREWIIAKAVSLLAASRINDNRVDRQRYAGIAQQKAEEAELFRRSNFFRRSDIPLWMEGNSSNSFYRNNPFD